MLKCFEVSNFMNFKNTFTFRFDKIGNYNFNQDCVNNGLISKGIIYGRNATGKTNLGRALQDIFLVIAGIGYKDMDLSNADSDSKISKFKYTFEFDKKDITYEYDKDSDGVIQFEKLSIDDKVLFELNHINKQFESLDLKLIDAESIRTEKYLDALNDEKVNTDNNATKLPFLRFILNNAALKNESPLSKLEDFVFRMRFIGVTTQLKYPGAGIERTLKSQIEYFEKKENLIDFENFLNDAGIECKLCIEKLPDGKKELYLTHHSRLLPFFESISSGTLSLTNVYMRLVLMNRNLSFIFLDEFDAFYHYEMSDFVVKLFKKKYPNTQVVMTTHNTNLMNNQIMRPDCLFILSGQGKITALCDATERELKEGHNLEKLYIAGEFDKYE